MPMASLKLPSQVNASIVLYQAIVLLLYYNVLQVRADADCWLQLGGLNRHGITTELIDEVLQGSMVSYFLIDDAEYTCEMVVGYTFTERLLEFGLRYLTADSVFVFHGQAASPRYRRLFEEEWDHG